MEVTKEAIEKYTQKLNSLENNIPAKSSGKPGIACQNENFSSEVSK